MPNDTTQRLSVALDGRYRLVRQIGEGGMATVYLARDLRHDRDVALKVLRPELAAVVGAERFLSEIKTTAKLLHPHILPLHDSGEADGLLFYVLPYVEGETLRDRLEREKQLPVAEAVRIATAVAGALQHAHDRGVVHRDIKPANVLLADGEPLVADFGIALAVGAGGSERLTETGLSLGTPYYMSPEQATGDQEVGPTSDVYSLAAVLYEMLTGEPPYTGSTAQAVLARIIGGAPASASQHRPSVPAHVDGAIRKALERVPADRFASTEAFARAIGDQSFRYGAVEDEGGGPPAGKGRAVALGATAVVSALAVGVLAGRGMAGGSPPAGAGDDRSDVVRYDIPVDPDGGVTWLGSLRGSAAGAVPHTLELALSPDGSTLVYSGFFVESDERTVRNALYLRRLDQRTGATFLGEGRPVAADAAEGMADDAPRYPFFSPDGTQVGYFAAGALRRRSLVDGEVVTVYEGALDDGDPDEGARAGFAWSDAGEILFISEDRLMRVPVAGGEPTAVELDLPEGRRPAHPFPVQGTSLVLFSALDFSDGPYLGEVRAVDLDSGEQWVVMDDAMDPAVVEGRHLIFMRTGTLMAATFDARSGRATGTPVAMVDSVLHTIRMPNTRADTGTGQYAVSLNGHLVYAAGGVYPLTKGSIVRRTPDGVLDTLDVPEAAWLKPHVDPDGRRLSLSRGARDVGWQLFVHDLERSVTQPVGGDLRTTVPGGVWNPEGTELAYNPRGGGVARVSLDGGAVPVPGEWESHCAVAEWAITGEIVCLSDGDLFAVDPESGAKRTVVDRGAAVSHPAVSPDGRWVAFVTLETGDRQVYVSPFRDQGTPWRVSIEGGTSPVWSPDGTRIHFRGMPQVAEMWTAAVIDDGVSISTRRPERWFDSWTAAPTLPRRGFDIGADGALYGVVYSGFEIDDVVVDRIQVYRNFAADVARRLEGGG